MQPKDAGRDATTKCDETTLSGHNAATKLCAPQRSDEHACTVRARVRSRVACCHIEDHTPKDPPLMRPKVRFGVAHSSTTPPPRALASRARAAGQRRGSSSEHAAARVGENRMSESCVC
eukprot:3922197-Prymnesium_polylepis.1